MHHSCCCCYFSRLVTSRDFRKVHKTPANEILNEMMFSKPQFPCQYSWPTLFSPTFRHLQRKPASSLVYLLKCFCSPYQDVAQWFPKILPSSVEVNHSGRCRTCWNDRLDTYSFFCHLLRPTHSSTTKLVIIYFIYLYSWI